MNLALPAVVTAAQAKELLAQWTPQLSQLDAALQVDASALRQLDSSCVALLLALKRRACAQGKALILSSPPAALLDLIQVYGLAEILLTQISTAPAG